MRTLLTAWLTFVLGAQSYPPAYPRPGATKMFENDRVQVWNIAWLKGQPSPLHRHIYDLVGVYYEPGDRMIVAVDGTRRRVTTKAGDIAFQLKGVTHIEEGTSESPLRAVFVEMKDEAPSGRIDTATTPPAFPGDGATQRLDNARVTVWEYAPSSTVAPQPHRHTRDAVVVWIDRDGGQAMWTARGTVHNDEPIGQAQRAYVFELK